MKFKEIFLSFILFFLISSIFFYKTFLNGYLPFPGDLLISEYNPWRSYSYLGYNPGSFPSKVQYFDVIRQLYPWKTLAIDLFKNNQIPLWNPYNFSGSPLLANFQSAVFYPFNILYFFLSQKIAWSLIIFIQPLLAGFFTYLFLREINLSKNASIFSSIAFSFSLFMSVFFEYSVIGNTFLWLPLILYLIEKNLKTISLSLIFLPLVLAFSFFAGHIQIFFYVFIFSAFYFIFRWARLGKNNKNLLLFGVCSLLFVGLSAVQLFPTLELINLSARVNHDYKFLLEKLLIQPGQLILFLSPDFFGNPATHNYLLSDSYPGNALYIGLIPFIFAIFGVFSKKNSYTKFFLAASAILLFLSIRTPVSEIFYKIQIPFFSTASPNNGIFLLSFSLAVLGGIGFDKYLEEKNTLRKEYSLIIFLFILFISIWLLIFTKHIPVSTKNFLYSSSILSIFAFLFFTSKKFLKTKNLISFLFIIISIFDLFYFFQKFNPFVPSNLIFPDTEITSFLKNNLGINRFWGYGTGAVAANFLTQYNIFSPDGYDPLYPKRYGEFIQSSKNGKIQTQFDNLNRSDAIIAPGYGETDLQLNKNRLKVLNLLGIKYILDRKENATSEKTFPVKDFNLIYENDGWRIFENLNLTPRFFLTDQYKVFSTTEEFENIFFAKDFNSSKTILLEENPRLHSNDLNHLSKNKVELIKYGPNKIFFQTFASSDQVLFLSDVYYPGWKAFIDGKETKILRSDYTFRSVIVQKGDHKIEFQYEPFSFKIGFYVTIFSVFSLIIFALAFKFARSYSAK